MTIEDRIWQVIEEARGCNNGNLYVGDDPSEPFFDMGLQGSLSHRVVCPDFWAEVQSADNSDDPDEAIQDLVADMVLRVEEAKDDQDE